MEDDLRWKMTFDGRRPSMEDNNEDDLKNWKAHSAGHIPLCGIFLSKFLRNKNEKNLSLLRMALSETLFCLQIFRPPKIAQK